MRILHIVGDGRPGGGTTIVTGLAERLAATGLCEVHLASQSGSYALEPRPGVTMHGVDFSAGRFAPRMFRDLDRAIWAAAPDIIHAHGARAGLPVTLLRSARRLPLVYTVHGYHFRGKRGLARMLSMRSEARIARQAALNLFVSRSDHDTARRHGFLADDAGRVIHNGIDLNGIPLPAQGDTRCIGFLGRLSHPKNPLMAVAVLDLLRNEGFRLLMVGGGEMEGLVHAAIAARGLKALVEVTGPLPRDRALARIREVGVLLLPSLWEGLPVAPLEAMAMDIPVVAAQTGGIPEVVLDGETGLLVPRQDPVAYAAAIRRLADDGALRTRLVGNARGRLLTEFSQDRMVRQHLDAYRDLVGHDLVGTQAP
jgi:glycosyltransferase involved in cell wall biosynthesis